MIRFAAAIMSARRQRRVRRPARPALSLSSSTYIRNRYPPSRGRISTLPSSAEAIRHFWRTSGKSVLARMSITPQAWCAASPCSSPPMALRTVRARAVATDDVVGPHLGRLAPVHAGIFQRHGHRVVVRLRVDHQVLHRPVVVGREPGGRVLHDVEEQLVHPGLVDQHMRHLGAVVGHVLHPVDPPDMGGVRRVGRPERRLVHPVALALDLVGETEGLEHLHRAGVDAVRFALFNVARIALDDHRVDLGELRELSREAQTGRAGCRRSARRPCPASGACGARSRRPGAALRMSGSPPRKPST